MKKKLWTVHTCRFRGNASTKGKKLEILDFSAPDYARHLILVSKCPQWPSLYSTCEHTIGLKPLLFDKNDFAVKNGNFHQKWPFFGKKDIFKYHAH